MSVVFAIPLGVLKVVGWILLGVLALILVILAIVLFAPIHYKANGQFGSVLYAHARVSWLLRLIQADVDFRDKKLDISYRILWIRKQLNGKKTEPDPVRTVEKKEEPVKPEAGTNRPAVNANPNPVRRPMQVKPVAAEKDDGEPIPETFWDPKEEEKPEEEALKPTLQERIDNIKEKIRTSIQNLIVKLQDIWNNVETWKQKIEKWIQRFQSYPGKRELVQLMKKELLYIIRRIRPGKLEIDLEMGLDDPSKTGQILGIYAILTSIWGCKGYSLQLEPDFEKKILEGHVDLKGRIALYAIVFPAIRIYFNKRVQKLIKDIKTIKEDF